MKNSAEAVIVGTEMLLGMGIDTNGADLGRRMAEVGCPLRFKTVVGDSDSDLDEVLARAVDRSAVVLVSGGLGPTEDDRTRFAVARVAGVDLELRPELLEDIRGIFQRLNREMGESNRVQALLPRGSEALRNPVGTAPGFTLEVRGAYVVALPGVPRELRHLLETAVLPRLRRRLGVQTVVTRVLRFSGVGESQAGEAVVDLMEPGRNPYVGILASPGEVRLFLTARGADEAATRALLAAPEAEIRSRLGKYYFGADDETHAKVALRAAARAGWTLATAEGFTEGALASEARASGAETFRGGIVLASSDLGRRVSEGTGPADAVLGLARWVAGTLGATAGAAVALEDELVGSGERSWVGVWTPGPTASRGFPLAFGREADRQRAVHQVFHEIRTLAGRAGQPGV